MALMRAASRLGLLLVAAVVLALVPTVAGAEDTVAFTIKDARITESSGLAVDPAGNLYWTVNDSGDRGVAYGIGLDGKVQGTLNFRAQPLDVEAVAVHEDRLYVADIGDNNGRRSFVRVYFFNNPRANGLTVTYHAYDFRYPDGPEDAETLLVDESGRLFIVTKGQDAAIYEAPAKPDRQGVNELEEVGSAPSNVTDGTFLPGGDRIALLTYNSVEVIDATSYQVMASAPIPDQPQAESLTLSLDERSLLVGSEGKKSKVYSVPVPSEATPTPTPEAPGPGQRDGRTRGRGQLRPGPAGHAASPRAGCFRGACGRGGCWLRPQTQLIYQLRTSKIARRRTDQAGAPQSWTIERAGTPFGCERARKAAATRRQPQRAERAMDRSERRSSFLCKRRRRRIQSAMREQLRKLRQTGSHAGSVWRAHGVRG